MKALFSRLLLLALIATAPFSWGETLDPREELGRYLFFDTRLSLMGNRSCALCHSPSHGWSNTFNRTPDIHGKPSTLNTPSLLNVVHRRQFSMTDPSANVLSRAILNPLFSEKPLEMGMTPELLIKRLSSSHPYPEMFASSFGDKEITLARIAAALGDYLERIQSLDSRVHRYMDGELDALSDEEILGWELFRSPRLNCLTCHSGSMFDGGKTGVDSFQNTGLYGIATPNTDPHYPEQEPGLSRHTDNQADNGKFRIPSLIDVANTGPWGHDGSIQSLESVIDLYAKGGREVTYGPNQGDGRLHPAKSPLVTGFEITETERRALMAFLNALSVEKSWTEYPFTSPFCQSSPLQVDITACDIE